MNIPGDIRKAALAVGIPLPVLHGTYQQFRQLARLEREPYWNIRRAVWKHYAYSDESLSFWRHGMHARFRRAFEEGDCTNIPGWDDVAKSMAAEFPELAGEDNISQRLFELIREPHQRMPTAEETWREVLDYLRTRYETNEPTASHEEVPF